MLWERILRHELPMVRREVGLDARIEYSYYITVPTKANLRYLVLKVCFCFSFFKIVLKV